MSPTKHPTRGYRQYTIEELTDCRITDLHATGFAPCECQLCDAMIDNVVYCASLFRDEGGQQIKIYVDQDCYRKLREVCHVGVFAAAFGA